MSVQKPAGFLVWVCLGAVSIGCHGGPDANDPSDEESHSDDMAAAQALAAQPDETEAKDQDLDFLNEMARRGSVQALKCDTKEYKGPRGKATVDVTFEPTGWSSDVVVHPPHEGTPIGKCLERSFQKLPHTGFEGQPVVVTQEVDFSKKKKD